MKSAWTALALGAAFAQGTALAQTAPGNGVTIYGRLDVVVDAVRFSSTPTTTSANARYLSTDTSYWGVRGTEDLGGGWRAQFKLENGFSVDTGALGSATAFWNREALVGVGHSQYGTVLLGSQYGPAFWITAKVDPFQRSGNGALFNLLQANAGNAQRGYRLVQDNAVQYISPTFAGFTGRVLYGLSERPSEPRDLGEFKSFGLEYAQGPFYAGLSYEDEGVATAPAGGERSKKTYTLGATYDFKFVKLHGYLLRNKLEASPGDLEGYLLGLTYPIGRGAIRTSYAAAEVDGVAGSKATVAAIGYTHELSKRTTLYTGYARLNNGATANFGLWPSSKTYGTAARGQDISSLQVGIRHFF
ncbi:porin [Noviherbaspirillum sp. CPCC 100848]|jgi:predicted porin|uniref:Porin n=1 Tax=Noviherbaspirillum album TaxID=3080276 RepID=A0ABU6JAA9_9BURK|nr:porin [Noviherbaspirillum sp. CPCC 100848]MEC4720363.1 porin [Noviherbaspirillum sp. CPCC 100848]